MQSSADVRTFFQYQTSFLPCRQFEGAGNPGGTGSNNDYVKLLIHPFS
jgi:hypothetical protein